MLACDNDIIAIEPQWRHQFNLLNDYIAVNPGIHIGMDEVSVPAHLRNEFYEHFDDVRYAFVRSRRGSTSLDLKALCNDYIRSENDLLKGTCLKRISLPAELEVFLHNPEEGMVRWLYNRLFELIQGRITEEAFESMAETELHSTAMEMYRLGYETWAALAIILLLEPDEFFGVALDDDYEPVVTGIDEIAFGRQFHHPAKRTPEFIIHSKKLDKHIAFKMPQAKEVDLYNLPVEIPTQRILRDRTGDTSLALTYRMIFLSVVPDLNRIPVFADLHERKVFSPDLTIEFLMEHDLSDSSTLQHVRNRLDIMKPLLGGSIVIINPETESDDVNDVKPEMNIEIFSAGLNPARLQPVIDRLI